MRTAYKLRKHGFFCMAFVLVTTMVSGQATAPADSMLLHALSLNNKDEVARLLNMGANANAADKDGDNALMYAALYANPECMKLLLDHHANVNNKNKSDETALMWSTHSLPMLTMLLDHGADINSISKTGISTLLIAAKGKNKYPVVKYLIDRGADCRVVSRAKETPLINAAMLGDTATLQLLVNKGVSMLSTGPLDATALHYAIFNENFDAAFWLVHHMPPGKVSDTIINLALTYAAGFDNVQLIELLVAKSTDRNWKDITDFTPLMWAVYNEHCNKEIVKILLKNKADPYVKGKEGLNAIEWAMKKGDMTVVDLLKTPPKN